MNKISGTYLKITTLVFLSFLFQINSAGAQGTSPEIPSSIMFGGITVKFDRSAQNLIEEDIKSLMSNKKFWEEKMDRAILYFPIVESILMDEEVPIDFKYLAVQESSFKPDVVSSSNAVGFWQFKPETGQELNLRIDKDIDERKNISSSTHAAAWYLKKNNLQLNNWVSSLYSYYQGVGGVKKLVPANWAYAREVTLSGKTDRYMLRFFAHKIALEAGIERYRTTNSFILMESEYGKGKTFAEISAELGIQEKELKTYNRWVNGDRIPSDKEYLVTLPVPSNLVASVRSKLSLPEQSQPVLASSSSTAASNAIPDETGFPVLKKSNVKSSGKNAYAFYEINGLPGIEAKAGDDAKSIAKAGNLRRPKFLKYNDMSVDMPIIPGNVYYLAKKNKKAAVPFHTAKTGDSWQSISQQYGVRLVNLLKYNRTISKTYPLQTGQVVWMNKKRPKNTPIEIIKPKPGDRTVTDPVIASAQVQPQPANDIPANASGRKKYTPVLVDKNQSSIAKEDTKFEPGVVPVIASAAPATVEIPTVAAKPTENTNDRVVIITQDNNDASFKEVQEPKAVPSKPAAKPAAKQVAISKRNTDSNPFATPSENASRTPANTQPVAFDNPLPPVKEKPVVNTLKESNSFHTVEPGQTFYSISRMYDLSVKELLAINHMNDVVKLSVGQKLIVSKQAQGSAVSKSSGTTKSSERTTQGSDARTHTVAAGETLFRISQNYEVSVQELQKLNKLSGNTVQVGQKLKIPQK
jgi:membrane-bound lytic murein transglycosylase D